MPFDVEVMQSHYGRDQVEQWFKRRKQHAPRPGGRARVLHLSMARALVRGPNEMETSSFVKKLNHIVASHATEAAE